MLGASAIGLLMMAYDKDAAIRGRRRVPESLLLTVALLGGSPGVICAMWLFRHKIRKLLWVIGLPVLLLVQVWAARRYHIWR